MFTKDKRLSAEKVAPENNVIIGITEEWIQEFLKENLGRKLTTSELEDLRDVMWDQDSTLCDWVYFAALEVTGKKV